MDLDQETQEQIQELQASEQILQQLLMQKQAFQMELNETETALTEIKDAEGDVFKIIGQIMIKKPKEKIKEDLEKKQKLIQLRLSSIEKQESALTESLTSLRDEIIKKLNPGNLKDKDDIEEKE
ncbi:MAG: prefoldin subunit beta [Candidatus Pacearchaeota archaeon]